MKIKGCAESTLPTEFGTFKVVAFDTDDKKDHSALILGEIKGKENVLVRIHSECLTGDVFHSARCDCRAQLEAGLKAIKKEESGILIYLRQEGRGIGLYNKIRAYALQDQGRDTVQANEDLGFEADQRDFSLGADILKYLEIQSVRILTNNPEKIKELESLGIQVTKRIPIEIQSNKHNEKYLKTKKEKLGHLFEND